MARVRYTYTAWPRDTRILVPEKTVQLKTALLEVYTYVLKGIFFQKTVQLQGFSVS